jgi:hypothetical protein
MAMHFAFYPVAFYVRNRFYVVLLRMTFCSVLLFVFADSYSQVATIDSGSTVPRPVYHHYLNEIGATARFYNGAEYDGAYPLVSGTPFWKEDGFQMGTLSYEGVVYFDVPLAFDLVQTALLTRGPQNQRWHLEKSKVDYFVLAGHTFINQPADTTSRNRLPEDIYDRLHNGDVKVFAKRSKVISRGFHAADRDSFSTRTAYFLYRNKTYYPISREKDLLTIFRTEREALKTFWKENKLTFKNEPESFLLKTIIFWSRLKK